MELPKEIAEKIEAEARKIQPENYANRLVIDGYMKDGARIALNDSAEVEAKKRAYAQLALQEAAKIFLSAFELSGIPNYISGTFDNNGERYVLHCAKIPPQQQLIVTESPRPPKP